MKALVQRVTRASVTADGCVLGSIGRGLLVFVGVETTDGRAEVDWCARKLLKLRVFDDEQGRMNRALPQVGGAILLVSQFTLCAELVGGNRPSFTSAMKPEVARVLLDELTDALRREVPVEVGRFGASMLVESVNDGPATFWMASKAPERADGLR